MAVTEQPDGRCAKALARARADRERRAPPASRARVRARTAGITVDLRIAKPAQLGNLLQHFTGSGEHNAALREAAVRRGLHVSEYGILDDATGETRTCASEQEVYGALGLAYIEPELRENRGELRRGARLRRAAAGPAGADRARGHPRRPAQPHDRLRRAQHDRGDGRGGARARLRVPGDHRPLRHATASATTSRPSSCAARSSWCTRRTSGSTASSCWRAAR